MSGGTPESTAPRETAGSPAVPPERFDDLLVRLRGLVERLEGGHISLEDGLKCFEEGMTLCKKGADILDGAERRVEVLLGAGQPGPGPGSGGNKSPRTSAFEASTNTRDVDE